MTKRIKALEERIESRNKKILKYQENIKKEREGIKKDEQNLIHVKYNDLLQKMMKNDIDSEDIERVIDQKIKDDKDTLDTTEGDSINTNNETN